MWAASFDCGMQALARPRPRSGTPGFPARFGGSNSTQRGGISLPQDFVDSPLGQSTRTVRPRKRRLFGSSGPASLTWPIHPHGDELVFLDESDSHQGRIFVYDLGRAEPPRMLAIRARVEVRGLQFDPTSGCLLYPTPEGTIGVWDWQQAGRVTAQKSSHLAVSADGRWIATASPEYEVVVYHRGSDQPVLTLPAESSEIWCLAWSPDGTRLAASLSDGGVVVWNLEEVRTQASAVQDRPAFDADGTSGSDTRIGVLSAAARLSGCIDRWTGRLSDRLLTSTRSGR